MNITATIPTIDSVAIIREGWNLLVEQLGLEKATQFVVLIERGKGDTVQEIADYPPACPPSGVSWNQEKIGDRLGC